MGLTRVEGQVTTTNTRGELQVEDTRRVDGVITIACDIDSIKVHRRRLNGVVYSRARPLDNQEIELRKQSQKMISILSTQGTNRAKIILFIY